MKLSELAEKTFSTIERGNAAAEINSAAGLDLAQADEITFLANPKYTPQIKDTKAGAIFLNENVPIERRDVAVLRAKDAYLAYTRALRLFNPATKITPSIHRSAVIDESAKVDESAEIGAHVVVGRNCEIGAHVKIFPNATVYDNVKIGANSVIHSGVSIRENCEVGENCLIHNNSTVGSDGFGYAKDENKRWLKIPQTGKVVIEDDVEIGANTAIDCASVGETRIKRGAKIDNLVQIGHSCTIDEDALICSQTGLAGSSLIGKRVILAGQVGIAGHLKVGDDAVVTAKSATSHDVETGKNNFGNTGFRQPRLAAFNRRVSAFGRNGANHPRYGKASGENHRETVKSLTTCNSFKNNGKERKNYHRFRHCRDDFGGRSALRRGKCGAWFYRNGGGVGVACADCRRRDRAARQSFGSGGDGNFAVRTRQSARTFRLYFRVAGEFAARRPSRARRFDFGQFAVRVRSGDISGRTQKRRSKIQIRNAENDCYINDFSGFGVDYSDAGAAASHACRRTH